jgi:hypothetical protein
MNEPNSFWGRPIDEYISDYQYEKNKQQGLFGESPGPTSIQEAMDALSILAKFGNIVGSLELSGNLLAHMTMRSLRSILRLVQYPKTYRHLINQRAIGGCIKLMSVMKSDSKISVRTIVFIATYIDRNKSRSATNVATCAFGSSPSCLVSAFSIGRVGWMPLLKRWKETLLGTLRMT